MPHHVSPILQAFAVQDHQAILTTGRHTANAPVLELIKVTAFSILEVALISTVGYVMARRGIIDKKTQTKINKLNVSIFTPALLFSKVAFSLTPGRLVELAVVPVGFVLVSLVSTLTALLLSKLFGISRAHRNFAVACAISPNSNSLPVALMQSLVATVPMLHWEDPGEPEDTSDSMLGRALTYLVLFSTLGMFLRWSVGAKLLSSVDEALPAGREVLTLEQGVRVGRLIDSDDDGAHAIPDGHTSARNDSAVNSGASRVAQRPTKKRSGPPGWAVSFPNSPAAVDNELTNEHDRWPDHDGDEGDHSQALLGGTKERPSCGAACSFVLAPLQVVNSFMTAPLWAAVLSLVVTLIPPLQHTIRNMEPVVGALETAGGCSIPLTLICLGSYFHVPLEERDAGGITSQSAAAPSAGPFTAGTEEHSENISDSRRPSAAGSLHSVTGSEHGESNGWRISSWNPWRSTRSVDVLDSVERRGADPVDEPYRDDTDATGNSVGAERASLPSSAFAKRVSAMQRKEENKTIAVAILSRMFVTPLLLVPLVAWYAISTHYNVVDDPVFIASACLIVGSPPALTLAQITTQSAGGDSGFERLISKTLFIAYTFLAAPTTIILVLIALLIAEND
ncbi:hypothetical protein K437DRAFT_248524 [Tilletiaria anomala UBC 951]|uniref:Auxin efflux carrier n=1 Tax=Tilletiaria anomala (strain ATCC 24038 / CBS 436.72 / UBC 951) TaxID=1037660 RepID=A0A066VXS7_TILAU|nr:uncharacterized protein K437DRAFT_248524 [Tilletiaria anomala UBC 951]KDN43325.1 hypothetical protein K437DRAFT_248524 [Tilletiaria anomala UBC 951]